MVNKLSQINEFQHSNPIISHTGTGDEMSSLDTNQCKDKEADLSDRPVLGVSACLLGKAVRFDGGHKKNNYILDDLSKYIDFVSTCPELEAGFGLPRPTMQLRQLNNKTRLVYSKDPDTDITIQMKEFSEQKVNQLSLMGLFLKKFTELWCVSRTGCYSSKWYARKAGHRNICRIISTALSTDTNRRRRSTK